MLNKIKKVYRELTTWLLFLLGSADKFAYVLRSCDSNLRSGGADFLSEQHFQWPEKGMVYAPDWKPSAQRGNGLHGWLNGEGRLIHKDYGDFETDKWLLVKVLKSEVIQLKNEVKFPKGKVLFVGSLERTILEMGKHVLLETRSYIGKAEMILRIGSFLKGSDHSYIQTGEYGVSITGDFSESVSGGDGMSITGNNSIAKTDRCGFAIGGHNTLLSGHRGSYLIFLGANGQVVEKVERGNKCKPLRHYFLNESGEVEHYPEAKVMPMCGFLKEIDWRHSRRNVDIWETAHTELEFFLENGQEKEAIEFAIHLQEAAMQ